MHRPPCPICKKRLPAETALEDPHFPFCSERCKLIDLGHWLDGEYRICEDPPPSQEKTKPPI